MSVGELLERIGSSELVEWFAIFDAEDDEAEKQRTKARR
jgi:hypothetical protein